MLLFLYGVYGGYMKRFIILAIVLLSANTAFAYNYSQDLTDSIIKEEQQVKYCPESQIWGDNCSDENKITFIKRITYGSGGFSIYEKDKALYDTDTTLEFIHNNQLFGYNMHKLKFFKLMFENDKFNQTELNEEQIKELFPAIDIIKVSDFTNGEITIFKPYFKPKSFMLVNDTDETYYKYQLEKYQKQDELIHSIFEIPKAGNYVYSHFGSRDALFPTLTIHVKNKLMKN